MIRSTRKVRKRDGREVPFDQAKIAEAIFAAARSVGGGDRFLAEELASVVTMFIDREYQERLPSIEDVSDLIEKVLVETGHAGTAKAFILERDRRARIRAALRVRRDESGQPAGAPSVDARTHATVSPWSKGKIVEALIVEADLSDEVAQEIAAQVERRVFASGLTRVSTALIRALVDNELFERGYDRVLNRQTTIGLPRYDLDRLARNGVDGTALPGCADSLDRTVARSSWSQYSLLAVHPTEVADAHLSGMLHLGCLDAPTRFQSLDLDLRQLTRPDGPLADREHRYDALRHLLRRAAELASESITLHGVEQFCLAPTGASAADPTRSAGGRSPRKAAADLLWALSNPGELPPERPGIRICLPISAPASLLEGAFIGDEQDGRRLHRDWLEELVRLAPALAAREPLLRPPELLLDIGPVGPADQDLLTAAVPSERDGLLGFLSRPALGGQLEPLSPVLLRVDVNLAQAAFSARRFDTRSVLSRLEGAIRLAADACEARARYFAGLPGQAAPRERMRRLLARRAGSAPLSPGRYEIGLAGLDAACRAAFERGALRDERARKFALALVKGARELIADQARRLKLPLACVFTDDLEVRRRFGAIDFVRSPRGRDVHGVPHDGRRYLYAVTLAESAEAGGAELDGPPEPLAALEAALRQGMSATRLPAYQTSAEERVRFLLHFSAQRPANGTECA